MNDAIQTIRNIFYKTQVQRKKNWLVLNFRQLSRAPTSHFPVLPRN